MHCWLSVSGQSSEVCQSGPVLGIPGPPTKCFVRACQRGMCISWYCLGAPVHLYSVTALETSQLALDTWSSDLFIDWLEKWWFQDYNVLKLEAIYPICLKGYQKFAFRRHTVQELYIPWGCGTMHMIGQHSNVYDQYTAEPWIWRLITY